MQATEINQSNRSTQTKWLTFERVLLVFSVIGTVLILTWVLRFSHYGIDFTDESFYLVWMANPFLYKASATQFGFVYHPLYLLLGGDIASLRQTNIILTFGLSWCLTYLVLRSLAGQVIVQKATMHIVAAGFATASLVIFDLWLPTPSYNSLAFQALLLTSIGVVLCDKSSSGVSVAGWVLMGIGGWLAFMAKPSTAAALAIGVLVAVLIARKFSLRMLLPAIASALALLASSAWLIDGSIAGFAERIRAGIEFGSYLGGGHTLETIIRWDVFVLGEREKQFIQFLALATFISMGLACSASRPARILSALITALFISVTAALTLGQIQYTAGLGQFQEMIFWGVIFAMVALAVVSGPVQMLTGISAPQWGVAFLFVLMPYIYVFGTNNNYWLVGPMASFFWVLGTLVLLGPLARARRELVFILPLVLAVQMVTVTLLQTGLERPYRQTQALRLNDTPTEIGVAGSRLILSPGYARYFEDVRNVAQRAEFNPDTPMIDLTGKSPGILFALGAENIGQAWTIGGYPGSLKLANAALTYVPCTKIAAAWLLVEPEGPFTISIELLRMQGADFPENYQLMGSWSTAKGASGIGISREQSLYAPVEQQTVLSACLAKRPG